MTPPAESVSRWLLTSNIRIREGRHKGAVAGWLSHDHIPGFVYTEITGFYLSWLASLQASEEIRGATHEALGWFKRIARGELPLLTRYYESMHEDDWRNRAVFTFDVAMAARGISDARSVITEDSWREPLQFFLQVLTEGCKADQGLPAYVRSSGELPTRWSTRAGPFQLKTAAAVIFGVECAPRELLDSAWNTYDQWSPVSPDLNGPEDLHPALYALEGLVDFGHHGISGAFELAERRFGELAGKLDLWPNEMRSDVVAQALRLSRLFESHRHRIAGLRALLNEFIDDAGKVSFRRLTCEPLHWNAWSAMFTYASLVSHGDGAAGRNDNLDRYSRIQ